MKKIYEDIFETKLGEIAFNVFSSGKLLKIKESRNQIEIETDGHTIQIFVIDLQYSRLPEGMSFETSKGWICKFHKRNLVNEQIYIEISLLNPSSETTWSGDTDEYLDAIEIENKINHLHIGTEDGLALLQRAEKDDFLPKRFVTQVGWDGEDIRSFTKIIGFGLRTEVPELFEREKIYFHYLVATNTIKPSTEYPEDRDNSTWWAVDKPKGFLENYIEKYYD